MEFSIGQVSVVGAYDPEPELVAPLSLSPAVWPEGWQPTLCFTETGGSSLSDGPGTWGKLLMVDSGGGEPLKIHRT